MSFFSSLAKIAGVVAAPFTGGASLAATALSAGADLLGGVMQNNAAADNSAAQMSWQERLSNTAHQREVADLKAAGLNPILTATGGSGASTPSGSVAPVQNILGNAVQTALAYKRLDNEIKLNDAQVFKNQTEARLNNALAEKAFEDAKVSNFSARAVRLSLPGLENEAKAQNSMLGRGAPYAKIASDILGGFLGNAAAGVGLGSGIKYLGKSPALLSTVTKHYAR